MEGLTRTESLIVARYSSRYPPPKAKELASELGVSIKTVYKALYKYRKLYGRLPSSTEDPSTSGGRASVKTMEDAEALLEAIYELKASIDRLNETLNRLLATLSSAGTAQWDHEGFTELPSFVKDNPWLQIIGDRSGI
ncbi:MAG: hypothetical protein QXP94_04210 [Thermofilaceae archaeon]